MRALWSRLRTMLTGRRRLADDLREEMNAHMEFEIEEHLAEGMTPEAARAAAKRQFGNTTLIAEKTRETWSFVWLETLLLDAPTHSGQ
jgi:hypothetical protein